MKTAAAYLRVSTDKQDEYSLDSQLKLIREYAAGHDLDVPQEFVFVEDGVSGRSAKKRPAFQKMIGMAKDKARPFDVILVWKYSRFARNQEESIVYKSMLKKLGVDVVSISEPLDDSPFGSLIERIIEWMDEFYSIRLSGEVKRGMAEKIARREIVTIPAFGYDVRGKTYVPNAQADTVRRIYREYLAGKGMQAIARQLGLEGVRTRRGNPPENRWVEYILTNPVYIGKIRWSKDGKSNYQRGGDASGSYLTDGHFEPLIPLEEWDAVQAKIAAAKAGRSKYERREQTVEWMLKGLCRCSAGNSTLVYTALSCPSMQCYKYAHGNCQTSHSLSISKANRQTIAALEFASANYVFPLAPHTVKLDAAAPDYEHLIAVERLKIRRIQEAYEAEIYTLQEYAQRKKEISKKIEELEQQAEQKRSEARAQALDPVAFAKKVQDVLRILKDPMQSESAKNAALKTVVSYIVYEKPAKRLAVYFYV